jgi:hypothetical protein
MTYEEKINAMLEERTAVGEDKVCTLPCLPPVICEECGGYCVWMRLPEMDDSECWLYCTKCHKIYEAGGQTARDQMDWVGDVDGAIKDIRNGTLESKRRGHTAP